jgi:hypothetical protein
MKISPEALKDPWRAMIAVNAAVLIGSVIYKIGFYYFGKEYLHLVVDYHFGFTKRAFIGQLVSVAFPVVPYWFAAALGLTMWLIALALFLTLFKRIYGFSAATAPLFVFIAGSPMFFKNFMHTLGNFDIYGCIAALSFLLLPARSFSYVVLAALSCAALLLIHHIHMLLYTPTIAVIVASRYYLPRGATVLNLAGGALGALALGAIFLRLTYFSAAPVSVDALAAHVIGRSADPAHLNLSLLHLWFRPLSEDITLTWSKMPDNLARAPIYAALIALHWPLAAYFRRLALGLAGRWTRRIMILGVAGATAGYVIMAMFVHDYARLFSNWAVCMMLIMCAIKMLPAAGAASPPGRNSGPGPEDRPAPLADDKWTRARGWIATLIPRVGTTYPF